MTRPPVERPPSELAYCPACTAYYWAGYPHDCPDDGPLGAARGIVFAVAACVVVYALVVLAGFLTFGWLW